LSHLVEAVRCNELLTRQVPFATRFGLEHRQQLASPLIDLQPLRIGSERIQEHPFATVQRSFHGGQTCHAEQKRRAPVRARAPRERDEARLECGCETFERLTIFWSDAWSARSRRSAGACGEGVFVQRSGMDQYFDCPHPGDEIRVALIERVARARKGIWLEVDGGEVHREGRKAL